jgi:hypothetical protein
MIDLKKIGCKKISLKNIFEVKKIYDVKLEM